jgi:hypothetical protein
VSPSIKEPPCIVFLRVSVTSLLFLAFVLVAGNQLVHFHLGRTDYIFPFYEHRPWTRMARELNRNSRYWFL